MATIFRIFFLIVVVPLLSWCLTSEVSAEPNDIPQEISQLMNLSFDELLEVKVTSASKKEQSLADVASAMTVLTSEDIRRSGATTIPELLRMVPGLNVAQLENAQWAISSRGFNQVFADKLLVLIDGRTVYSSLSSGVFWWEHSMMLEDIDRIEVIKGPGSTIWGFNAVNGVINVITKGADKTQGWLVSGATGSQIDGLGTVRYGGQSGATSYRLYARGDKTDGQRLVETGEEANDFSKQIRTGFRSDTTLEDKGVFTFQSEVEHAQEGWDLITPSISRLQDINFEKRRNTEAVLQGKWSKRYSNTSEASVLMYGDYIKRDYAVFLDEAFTTEIDGQYRFSPFEGHDVVAGATYRHLWDHLNGLWDTENDRYGTYFDPISNEIDWASVFVEDSFDLIDDFLTFTAGGKVEYMNYAGPDLLPSARLLAHLSEHSSLWGAVSRSERTQPLFSTVGHIALGVLPGSPETGGLPVFIPFQGNRDTDPEQMWAYETGFRSDVTKQLSVDIASFYARYDDMESGEPVSEPFPVFEGVPHIEAPIESRNMLNARTIGGEVSVDWHPSAATRLVAWYSYIDTKITKDAGSQDFAFSPIGKQNPRNQVGLRAMFQPMENVELDPQLRYVGGVDVFDIDSYYELDLRVAYHLSKSVELALIGQNLLDEAHQEFTSNLVNTVPTEIKRAVLGKVTWRF